MGERLPLPHHLSCCCNAARIFKPVSENFRGRHISLHDAQNCSSACNPAAAALGRFSSPPHRESYNSLTHVFMPFHALALAFSLALQRSPTTVSDIYIIDTLWPRMHPTKPSLQPQPLPKPSPPLQRPPVWRRLNNPSSPSRSSLTRSSNRMNLNGFNLPTHVDRSTKSSSARKTSPTPNIMPSVTSILPALKTPRPGESLQSGEVVEKKVTAGKPLLERLGMRELTLLERLGMPIRKGTTSQTCDGTGMTMTIPLEVSRSRHETTMMSTTRTTLGTGVRMGEDLLGGVERMSALNKKLRCSSLSITPTPTIPAVAFPPNATLPHTILPPSPTSSP